MGVEQDQPPDKNILIEDPVSINFKALVRFRLIKIDLTFASGLRRFCVRILT